MENSLIGPTGGKVVMEDPGGGPPDNIQSEANLNSTKTKSVTDNATAKNNILYTESDKGPFFVYLESTEKVGYAIGKANNIKIARDLFNLNLTDIKKISNKGQNRIAIQFITHSAANAFIKNKYLIDKGYNIYIPFNFVTAKGIARNVDFDLTEEELLNACKANDKTKILGVRRLNRKILKDETVSYEPTGTVLFTFQGVLLPKYISFYHLEYPISTYVAPVTQCYKCLRYGHTRNNCKGKDRCFNCGSSDHVSDNNELSCTTTCFYCKDNHKSTNKICPEYNRQKNIKELMAYENLTFYEANEVCRKTYCARDDFIYNSTDFPSIRNKGKNIASSQKSSENLISPNERRTNNFNNNPVKRSYQQVLSTDQNKKRIIQKGYNKKLHDEALFFPNARPLRASQTPQQTQPFRHIPILPTTSASSDSQNSISPMINLDSVISFIRNASNTNKNICYDVIRTEMGIGSYMDLDQISDSN